jgi:[acyl-carrier-protein] S-malonyltransferase
MAPARDGLRERLETADFRDPVFPVVSNVTGMPVVSGPLARELLVEQLTSPVRWSATITTMLGIGADRFLELGSGSVLCGLNKRNARGLPCTAVGEPLQLDALGAGASVT